jgi:hypothetical protein
LQSADFHKIGFCAAGQAVTSTKGIAGVLFPWIEFFRIGNGKYFSWEPFQGQVFPMFRKRLKGRGLGIFRTSFFLPLSKQFERFSSVVQTNDGGFLPLSKCVMGIYRGDGGQRQKAQVLANTAMKS